ncbi:MAG: helix-turn-helix domain-containing protein [Myxococcota bacterium]|nr:helix-turn-helix domain-containing protein [Myxococcota bacterium]
MSEPWVSVDEVSSHLGVAKDTIYRWIESRELPAHRVGRLWKFKLSEVDAWVEQGGAGDEPRKKPTRRRRT